MRNEAHDTVGGSGGLGPPKNTHDEQRSHLWDQESASTMIVDKAGGVRGPSHSHGSAQGRTGIEGTSAKDGRRVTVAFGLEAALSRFFWRDASGLLLHHERRQCDSERFVSTRTEGTYLKKKEGEKKERKGDGRSMSNSHLCRRVNNGLTGENCSEDLACMSSSDGPKANRSDTLLLDGSRGVATVLGVIGGGIAHKRWQDCPCRG